MTETRNFGKDLQDEILRTVRRSQAAVVDAIQTWAATVQSIAPELPDVNVPFADKLPKPSELVASAYDFAEQLLASQRKFAEDVVRAMSALPSGENGKAGQDKAAK
jgi:hypothetical protein